MVCGFLWFKHLQGVDTNESTELFMGIFEAALQICYEFLPGQQKHISLSVCKAPRAE